VPVITKKTSSQEIGLRKALKWYFIPFLAVQEALESGSEDEEESEESEDEE
jgi:hypothetical protein